MDQDRNHFDDEVWRAPDQGDPSFIAELGKHLRFISAVAVFVGIILVALLVHRPDRGEQFGPTPASFPPAAKLGPALAYDQRAGGLVMFGGVGNDARTWTWKAGQWILWHTKTAPSSRFDASAVWDPSAREVKLFGGEASGTPLTDLWRWDGDNWSTLDDGKGLPAAIFSRLAYDGNSHLLTLLLSAERQAPIQVWVWSRSSWHRVSNEGPSLGSYSAAFDPTLHALLVAGPDVFGNVQTWLFRHSKWTPLLGATPGFNGEIIVEDPGGHRVVGLSPAPGAIGSPTPTQTWAWEGSVWTLLEPRSTLSQQLDVLQVTEDLDRQRVLAVVGASRADNGQPWVNEIWAFTGGRWIHL